MLNIIAIRKVVPNVEYLIFATVTVGVYDRIGDADDNDRTRVNHKSV